MRWVRLIANLPLKLPRKNFELRGALAKRLLIGFDIFVLGPTLGNPRCEGVSTRTVNSISTLARKTGNLPSPSQS
jgi:hypothetical protein